jgi:hypothetical protein
MLDKQTQDATEGSTAIQAGGNVVLNITQGLSATEVRQIVLDVLQVTLAEYKGVALAIAKMRGEEITEKLVEKLLIQNPEGIQQAQTPDFQDSLFFLQKEYAKVGDDELGDLLVNLLVDQTKEEARTLLRNVLNEALRTAPRLTASQIAAISALFIIFNVTNQAVESFEVLGQFLDKHLRPFVGDLEKISQGSISHLEFVGCGTNQPLTQNNLEETFGRMYLGLFQKGISDKQVSDSEISAKGSTLFITCINDAEKKQVAALNEQVLREKASQLNLPEDEVVKLLELLKQGAMAHPEIKDKLLSIAPYLQNVFQNWEKSPVKSFYLSVIGRAIAHGNVKRVIGETFAPLSVWVS